jgi:hypothetical protein
MPQKRRHSATLGSAVKKARGSGKAYMGSGAIFGKLTPSDLETTHRSNGSTLASCIESAAVDVEAVRAQEKLFDVDNARAYLELQIEEGPVMVACKLMEMDDFIRGVHAMSAVFDRLCERASCPRR